MLTARYLYAKRYSHTTVYATIQRKIHSQLQLYVKLFHLNIFYAINTAYY